ncbi:hypothetical protein CBR_g3640 [Chara braunii]|uniref:Reverse transcriptase domain-containing protein n=1 Tax=Chara braunii TaxID=69332 RepID=A0A388KFX3_CHABU|nr:hypothetical protein CBR_g3640 [Chara braunii]|eukprot:GBG68941.1 hypothetical protein CBR_g3640 [Chara braunii]
MLSLSLYLLGGAMWWRSAEGHFAKGSGLDVGTRNAEHRCFFVTTAGLLDRPRESASLQRPAISAAAEEAQIAEKLREQRERKEAKKKQEEEDLKNKLEEEKVKMEEEMKRKEEEMKKQMEAEEEDGDEEEEEGEEEEEEERSLVRREKGDGAESGQASHLQIHQGGEGEWMERFGFRSEMPDEDEKEKQEFEARLEKAEPEERGLLIAERDNLLHQRLLSQKRREIEEKKKLREEGEALQRRLKEQRGKETDTKEALTLMTDALEDIFTNKLVNTIAAIKRGGGGGGGDGGDPGDDGKGGGDRKGDVNRKGNEQRTEGGERREKMKLIPYHDRVLMASSCLGGGAANFALSLMKTAGCSSMVEYSQRNRIEDFMKALKERFEDKNLARRTEYLILNICNRRWKSVSALKSTMDELLQCPEHGLTPTQILNNFARALPNPLKSQLYAQTKEEGMTYEKLSKIAVDQAGFLQEANYCHYWKDLQKGNRWKNKTISGNIEGKDGLLVTFEEGGVEALPYENIDYGLEDPDSNQLAQGGDNAVVAARGGGRQGGRGGRGRGGRGRGGRGRGEGRGRGTQGSSSEGSYYVGGRGNGSPQGGCGSPFTGGRGRGRKPWPANPGIADGEPWKEMGIDQTVWQKRLNANQCLQCGDPYHILILGDVEISRTRVGALVDSGSTRSFISRRGLKKLHLGMKVQKLSEPVVRRLVDNREVRVEEYVEGIKAYFRLEEGRKVEKVLHSLTLLVEDNLPFDLILGTDWGESTMADVKMGEHECWLPSPTGGKKKMRLFHESGLESHLSVCCMSAPAFARHVTKEKLEDQVFVAYVKPVSEESKGEDKTPPQVENLLQEFVDIEEAPTGVVERDVKHRIEIEPGSKIPRGPVYRMSPKELDELRRQLDELIEKGWIKPSSSPYGAPVLFVPKKEGELRLCIDYRGLNAITVKNAEPLPRIDDLLDRVQGCKYFSKIDLKSGYHQVEAQPEDQHKTAFRTRYGHYEFVVMPFGLTNAPATFQRCMNDLFRDWLDKFVVVYLDDILNFSKSLEEHQNHLCQILTKLRESNFKINPKKCEWAKRQVLYLGHVVDGDGVRPEGAKIAAIRDWPTPHTLTELRSFLGLANYCRKFVRNFTSVAAPLRRLLRKETVWNWDKDCTSAFKRLKKSLIEYPVLKVADPSLPFVITTDASQYGIGAVLQHQLMSVSSSPSDRL